MALENLTKEEPKGMSTFKKAVLGAVAAGLIGTAIAAGYTLNHIKNRSSECAEGFLEIKTAIYNGMYKDK